MYKIFLSSGNFVIKNDDLNIYEEHDTNDVRISKINSDVLYYDIFFNGDKRFSLPLRVIANETGTVYSESDWDAFRFNSTGGDAIASIIESAGASTKNYLFRNQNYLNSGSALDVKTAGEFLFFDISSSSTLSARSANDDFVIDNTKMHFKDNFIYDMKVKLKLEPEVSSNHLELALAKDTFNVYDESTITTSKLQDARYEVEFNGFHYTADKGDVKLFVSKCITGGSSLKIHTIKIVIKEIGENLA